MSVEGRTRRLPARRPVAVAAAVAFGVVAYAVGLRQAVDSPVGIVGVGVAAMVGGWACGWVWSILLVLLGPSFGLRTTRFTVGAGPAWRTGYDGRRTVVLRRVPLPLVRVRLVRAPASGGWLRFTVAMSAAAAVLALIGAAMLSVAPPYGTSCGLAFLGGALLRFVLLAIDLARPGATWPTAAERADLADAEAANRVIAAVQQSVPEARRIVDGWSPERQASANGRATELMVRVAEGRYRDAATLAETLAQDPRLPDGMAPSILLTRARALAYGLEAGEGEPADRESFLALHEELRAAPEALTGGADLRALYLLIGGDPAAAVDAAHAEARVGSLPLRRSMTYCTLAVALDRAGRRAEARKALDTARAIGPATARIDFLARTLAAEPAGAS